MLITAEDYQLRFATLTSGELRFFLQVRDCLEAGVKPTPKVVNMMMNRNSRQSLNGVECKIRTNLLQIYGYELVGRYWRKGPLEL